MFVVDVDGNASGVALCDSLALVMRVQIQKLRADAVVPRYMSEGAAGLDLAAALDDVLVVAPGERYAVPTGLAIAIDAGFEGQVRPRSGLSLRSGLTVANAPGTIDSDYRER